MNSSNEHFDWFPAPEIGPGVWSLVLATLPQPVEFRRVEPLVEGWMSGVVLEAVKAWAMTMKEAEAIAPERHQLRVSPQSMTRMQKAMEADRMVLGVLGPHPFQVRLPGWPVSWVQVTSIKEAMQRASKGLIHGLMVQRGAEGTPDPDDIRGVSDLIPVLTAALGSPQPFDVLPCAEEDDSWAPMTGAYRGIEDWLCRAGHAGLQASLARRSLCWRLACTHWWEADTRTVVTEVSIASEEKVRHVAKSKDTVPFAEIPEVRFNDVIGMAREKRDLLKAVQAHMAWRPGDPQPPKGYLLTGPPGTGKTFFAKALAGEAGLPILALAAADVQTMWYGETERKIREVFAAARQHRPSIIFFDEIDALAMRRDDPRVHNPDAHASIVSTLLDCLDGFSKSSVPVLVLAATNHPEMLDRAFVRAGRFDRAIQIDLPGEEDREAFFRAHLPDGMLDERSLKEAVRFSLGLSFADLAQLIKDLRAEEGPETGLDAAHRLREGLLRRLLGDASEEPPLDEPARRAVAVHEAGHAIGSMVLLHQPPDYLSIRPRGRALGVTVHTKMEGPRLTASVVKARIAVMLAGRAAEVLFLPEATPSAGSADDLAKATELALNAIGSWGLEPAFGLASMATLPESIRMSLTPSLATYLNAWLAEGEAMATTTLRAHHLQVEALVEALLREGDLDEKCLRSLLPDSS